MLPLLVRYHYLIFGNRVLIEIFFIVAVANCILCIYMFENRICKVILSDLGDTDLVPGKCVRGRLHSFLSYLRL